MDPAKAAARTALTPAQQEIFDLVAPPAGTRLAPARRERLRDFVERLVAAALKGEPMLDPGPRLARVPVPVFLAHGRGDRLIPWTELVRLREALPAGVLRHAGITSLFSHSFGEKRLPTPRAAWEAIRFVRLIHRMIHLV